MKANKPLLRWAGSKRQLLPQLAAYWPGGSTRYVEPFAGSASFFFHLAPRKAILGDLNEDLIGTYEAVRSSPESVSDCLRCMPSADSDYYYQLRAAMRRPMPASKRAAAFIYLNRFCFNGLYRTNHKGQFNVPFSGDRTGSLPTADQIRSAAAILERVELVCGDFEETLRRVKSKDFVYLDPPYWVTRGRVFREYAADAFNANDLGRLRKWLLEFVERRIPFVLSYALSPQGFTLAEGLNVREVSVRRNIAGFADSRRRSTELLITPYYLELRTEASE